MERDTNKAEFISAEHFALSPLDGRYAKISKELSNYFSEYALVKNRVKVEVCWLSFLLGYHVTSWITHQMDISDYAKRKELSEKVMSIYHNFSDEFYARVKEIESVTNHDVKAVELFVGEKLEELGLASLVSYVHIGCTSEDITNTAYGIMISSALKEVWIPTAEKLITEISEIATAHATTAMLAHTHGQPATPTTIGKEMQVYVYRMKNSLKHIKSINVCAKFNGATGNYSALSVAFPDTDWPCVSKTFVVEILGLQFNPVTTQIESHDYVCHILDGIRHFNNVLRDFDLDMWLYISKDYFKQIAVKTEVGSSTMPHKVNPIKFENSEANIKMSNAICSTISDELPRSRLQRDLSDSSLQRNIGIAFGYSLQSMQQTIAGLKKVEVNKGKLTSDLNSNWEVLAEPIQTVLRKYGISSAYNQLKELTRGKKITKKVIHEFINSLEAIPEEDKAILLALKPSTYTGEASNIAKSKFD